MKSYQDIIAVDKEDVESPQALADDSKRHKLSAEVTFDKAVYGGISYWAQMLTGIGLSYWFKHGSGKAHFEKITHALGPKLFKGTAAAKGVEAAAEKLHSPLIVTTMVMVGNTFLIPVLWLEKRKPEIVRWIHEHTTAKQSDYSEENRAKDEEALKALENAPPQDIKSLLGGRAFGLTGVFAGVFALGKTEKMIQTFTTKTAQNTFHTIGLKTLAKSEVAKRVMDISFLDAFYSAVAAGGLYAYSHFIKPPQKHNEPPKSTETIPKHATDMTESTSPASLTSHVSEKKFQDSIKQQKSIIMPAQSHAHKLALQELSEDARVSDRMSL